MTGTDRIAAACLAVVLAASASAGPAMATDAKADRQWMNSALSPDARAELVLKQMTMAEKQSLVHGIMPINMPFLPKQKPIPADAVGSAGYVPGVPRLSIPALQETDASLGIANPMSIRPNDVATALPSSLATAASFDIDIAYAGGATIGKEAHQKGFNVLLAGGVNLAREPRSGRNFEYLGEDPLLAGTLDGAHIRGIQDQHVISTVKHYAINDQETNRNHINAIIDEKSLRESDLLAFQFAIEQGKPGSVMCSYNLINGAYGCGNDFLLNKVLKGDWQYPGWVMSDWGAVHELNYAVNGLDQQSAAEFDIKPFFAEPLTAALKDGGIPASRLDDMARRILRSMFAVGVIDHPPVKAPVDAASGDAVAQKTAEAGIVLLKNSANVLPFAKTAAKIAVIGGNADAGVVSGGGSSQVIPAGSMVLPYGSGFAGMMRKEVYHPSSPLAAIKKLAPNATVKFADGRYTADAVRLAKWADIVIVFGTKWQAEGSDVPDLSLPNGQDGLIDAVASANAKTVVVLETGNPVLMPWLSKAAAVMEAWYPGSRGGEAIANVLFGTVNPSGRLPVSFPADIAQNPRPEIPGYDAEFPMLRGDYDRAKAIPVHYTEGADIGYRWMSKNSLKPLFPFGYGLSYTMFAYNNLKVSGGETLTVSFDVMNSGSQAGKDTPQVYLTGAAGEKVMRLIGFTKLELKPGETKHVSLTADRRLLANYDVAAKGWKIKGGSYTLTLAKSAADPVATASAQVSGAMLKP